MGLLVNGQWQDRWYDTESQGGEFVRAASSFRHWITADGSAGPDGAGGFKAESGRYHLYVAMACPWAHRTLIFRKLKGLEEHISVSIVHPHMLEHGWSFHAQFPDQLYAAEHLYDIYLRADAQYTGRVTVPVLWDKQQQTIVNNESAEIIRMLNQAFDGLTGNTKDYYPEPLRPEIDSLNDYIYENINNGVYRAGFATSQEAYQRAFTDLFAALNELDRRLATQRYLMGNVITEADWRLFTTLVRFDAVYYGHFKTNLRRIEDYPNLSGYVRDLYQQPGIADTVDFAQIKRHYYYSHASINPSRIVPLGPLLDYHRPHGRAGVRTAAEG